VNPESSGFPRPFPGKSRSTAGTSLTLQAHLVPAEGTPKVHDDVCIIPCRFSYFCQYHHRRGQGGWLFTSAHFSLTDAFRTLNRDDALYHAKLIPKIGEKAVPLQGSGIRSILNGAS